MFLSSFLIKAKQKCVASVLVLKSIKANLKIFDLGLLIIYLHKQHIFHGTGQKHCMQTVSPK